MRAWNAGGRTVMGRWKSAASKCDARGSSCTLARVLTTPLKIGAAARR